MYINQSFNSEKVEKTLYYKTRINDKNEELSWNYLDSFVAV